MIGLPTISGGITGGNLEGAVEGLFQYGTPGVWYDAGDINNYVTADVGPELILNGGFDTTSDWLLINTSIAGGILTVSSTVAARAEQSNIVWELGKTYRIQINVPTLPAGTTLNIERQGQGGWIHIVGNVTVPGISTFYHTVRDSGYSQIRIIRSGTAATSTVESISVREVPAVATGASMFQDISGLNPVTNVEQTVSIILDKRQSTKIRRYNQFTGTNDFTGSWVTDGINATRTAGTAPDGTNTAVSIVQGTGNNRFYHFDNTGILGPKTLSFYAKASGGSTFAFGAVNVVNINSITVNLSVPSLTSAPVGSTITLISDGWYRIVIPISVTVASGNSSYWVINGPAASVLIWGIQIESGSVATPYQQITTGTNVNWTPGNHAYQSTPTSAPTLRARYNLLTYSEQFNNAVWQSASSGTGVAGVKTPNFGTAPDGTQTACRIQLDVSAGSTGNQSQIYQNYTSVAGNITYQCYVKTNDGSTKTIMPFSASGTPITVTGTWQLFTSTRTSSATDNFQFILVKGTTSDTADLLVWHPQSNFGSVPSDYQRIAAATDYDTAGFKPYLAFDGIDDSLVTNSIDFASGPTNPPLGQELVTGAASAYTGNGTVSTVGDTITATCTTNGIYGITWASTFVSNLWVVFTVEVVTNSASKSMLIFPNGNSVALAGGTTTGSKSFIALAPTATGSTRCPIFYINGLVGESFSIRLVSIKEMNSAYAPDKMSMFAGITKNSDALRGVFAHLGSGATATFRAEAPDAGLNTFTFYTAGTGVLQGSGAVIAAPATRVFTGIGDIASDINLLRLNGVQVGSNATDQGTGNYSNNPLYVGRRGDNSLFFNGRIYSLIVAGIQPTSGQTNQIERYVAGKTGITL